MTIRSIIQENGAIPQLCKNGGCPSAVIADDGNVYVQGYHPSPEQQAALSAPRGEGFVRMPLEVLHRIAAYLPRR